MFRAGTILKLFKTGALTPRDTSGLSGEFRGPYLEKHPYIFSNLCNGVAGEQTLLKQCYGLRHLSRLGTGMHWEVYRDFRWITIPSIQISPVFRFLQYSTPEEITNHGPLQMRRSQSAVVGSPTAWLQ